MSLSLRQCLCKSVFFLHVCFSQTIQQTGPMHHETEQSSTKRRSRSQNKSQRSGLSATGSMKTNCWVCLIQIWEHPCSLSPTVTTETSWLAWCQLCVSFILICAYYCISITDVYFGNVLIKSEWKKQPGDGGHHKRSWECLDDHWWPTWQEKRNNADWLKTFAQHCKFMRL